MAQLIHLHPVRAIGVPGPNLSRWLAERFGPPAAAALRPGDAVRVLLAGGGWHDGTVEAVDQTADGPRYHVRCARGRLRLARGELAPAGRNPT